MDLKFLKHATSFIFTEECTDRYFDDLDFFHVECFKATLSKCLGIAIISGSLFVKVPQIVKILKSKSVEGINLLSVMIDIFCITAMCSYSFSNKFPFSAWGDGVFLALQTVVIAELILYDKQNPLKAITFLIAYISVVASVATGLAPHNVLWACQAINTPAILWSKLIQAYTNYKNGSTGQLSAITLLLMFFGSLARIFTSIQETGDMTIIIMYCWTSIANGILVLQLLYYWNADTKVPKDIKKSK